MLSAPRRGLISLARFRVARHADQETTPLPRRGSHLNTTAMLLDGGLGDMQAQPRALFLLG